MQSKFTIPWPLRSAEDTMRTVSESKRLQGMRGKKGLAEEILKEKGLRDVDVSTTLQIFPKINKLMTINTSRMPFGR